MIKILVKIPGKEVETLAALGAMRETIKYFPYQVFMDAAVSTESCKELVVESSLASNVYSLDDFSEAPHVGYDLVYTVDPTLEMAHTYSEESKAKKLDDMMKFLGKAPEGGVPGDIYGIFSTVTTDFARALQGLRPSYDITDYLEPSYMLPYAYVRGKTKKSIKTKFRTSIAAEDGKPVRDDYYMVFLISDDASEEYRDTVWEWCKVHKTAIASVYVESNGTVWGSSEVLTTAEQVALIENPNCLGVIGEDWRIYLSWIFSKPLTFQLIDKESNIPWKGVSSTNAIIWALDKRPLSSVKEIFKDLIAFNTKEFFKHPAVAIA